MAKKRPPGKIQPSATAAPKTPWYRRVWVVLSFIGAGLFGLLANGPTLLANAEKLPSEYERVSGHFLSWFYEDQAWEGLWIANPEGYVDIVDMRLSDVDLKLHLMSERGRIGGEIATKSICRAAPLLDYFLLDGKVSLFDTKSATITAWDIVGGEKQYFFRFVVRRDGPVVTVSPSEGTSEWLPAIARIGLDPRKGEDPYKQLTGACAAEREDFLKKIRPSGLGRERKEPVGTTAPDTTGKN